MTHFPNTHFFFPESSFSGHLRNRVEGSHVKVRLRMFSAAASVCQASSLLFNFLLSWNFTTGGREKNTCNNWVQ